MPRTLPELLQTGEVEELRACVRAMSTPLREAFLKRYFAPALAAPSSQPRWLETDPDAYRSRLRDACCAVRDEEP